MNDKKADIDAGIEAILEAWPSNADYLDDLKERGSIQSAAPLVPFVGAGLSMPMGFQSWTSFLKGLAEQCGLTDETTNLLKDSQYEEAAELVQTGMSVEIFNDRLRHVFGERRVDRCTLKGAVLALPAMCHGPVITTNFDRLLERVFREAGKPFARVVLGAQVDTLREAVAENKAFLLKIHGDAEERIGRVLTKTEFDGHYGVANTQSSPNQLRAQLRRLFESRTLLFLGCSLESDRTMQVLLETARAAAGLRHYAVMERPADDKKLYERSKWLGEHSIRPIWFPHGRHDLIEPLLRWLGAEAGAGPEPSNAPPGGSKLGQTTEAERTGQILLRGSRAIQILISQHFRIADLLIYPERVRTVGFAPVLNSGAKMRRALNRRKPLKVGGLGTVRPVATISGYSDPYWQDSIPDFRAQTTEPQVWFFPFELNLGDFLKKDGYTPESMLKEILDDSGELLNQQVSARLRIYPPGVGVIRLSITLTFRNAVDVELVAKVAQELEGTLFTNPDGGERPVQDVLVKIIDEVAQELFTEQDTTPSGRRWRPPEITYFVRGDQGFSFKNNIWELTQLLSLAPENKERTESLERRLEEKVLSQDWTRNGLVALSSMRVGLLLTQPSESQITRRRRSQMIDALLETGEVIAAGAYSLQALVEKLTRMGALRTLEDSTDGGEQKEFLIQLLKMIRRVLQAIAAAKLDVNRRRIGALIAFAGAVWRHSNLGRQDDLPSDLRYVQEWGTRLAGDGGADEIVRVVREIQELSDPFRRARPEVVVSAPAMV